MATRCLVFARTGKRCQSCKRVPRNATYVVLRSRGLCVKCRGRGATRGVYCDRCYANERARQLRSRTHPGPVKQVTCHNCWEKGHFAKTCDRPEAFSARSATTLPVSQP